MRVKKDHEKGVWGVIVKLTVQKEVAFNIKKA
jgi:hypothetical protein